MLQPEEAKARLSQWQLPSEHDRIARGLGALPAALRAVAEPALEIGRGFADPAAAEKWRRRKHAAAVELDRLPAPERAQVFNVVAPQLAATMERAWQLLKATPFQVGYYRKAFRAPHHPLLTIEKRLLWLNNLAMLARRFPPELLTPVWLATWAAHLNEGYRHFSYSVGPLLAAVLDQKYADAEEVWEILRQSLNNQHEIGAMGRHVYSALLLANRQEGWELMERTLLAAQRQEGLRQAILEAIDESRPEAFRRMLRVILDEDLIRFASVVRAVDVWFGQLWAAAAAGPVKKMLGQVLVFLEHPEERSAALAGRDAESAFLALWCAATDDAIASVPPAQKLLDDSSVEMRYIAARHLANLSLDVASEALVPALADDDLRVAVLALTSGGLRTSTDQSAEPRLDQRFEQIELLAERVPEKPKKLPGLVWPWTETLVKQSQVAAHLLSAGGQRPPVRLIPHLSKLEPHHRRQVVQRISAAIPWDAATRAALVALAGDASADVRATTLEALGAAQLAPDEVERLEGYLTRKAGDLRRGVLELLLRQADAAALASCKRLLAAKDGQQRLAGLELLRHLAEARRCGDACRQLAADYCAKGKKLAREEQSHLDQIAKDSQPRATLADALGLMNPAERTPIVPPQDRCAVFASPASIACLGKLDELIHQHRETTVTLQTHHGGSRMELLGNLQWGISGPKFDEAREPQRQRLPLEEVWSEWSANRATAFRDDDGLELLRASICSRYSIAAEHEQPPQSAERKRLVDAVTGGAPPPKLRYPALVRDILAWLLFLNHDDAAYNKAGDYLLDAVETLFALVPEGDMARLAEGPAPPPKSHYHYGRNDDRDWRTKQLFETWRRAIEQSLVFVGRALTQPQLMRYWQLMHWCEEPFAGAPRRRVDPKLLFAALDHHQASLADVADHLLGPRREDSHYGERFDLLAQLTSRKFRREQAAWLQQRPQIQELIARATGRILELELARGDAPTAATPPAQFLGALWGINTLCSVLQALGKSDFKLGQRWRQAENVDRRQTLTHLAQITFPAEGESAETCAQRLRAAVRQKQFPPERVLQLTFLAPQWTRCVEAYCGWPQMSEGVYWFLAHMNVWGLTENAAFAADDNEEQCEPAKSQATAAGGSAAGSTTAATGKKLSAWERLILERTPLSREERNEGAIDVAWFQRSHELLGPRRWQELADAAHFAANASQAKRAKFIANVLLNRVKRSELIEGIRKKQLKDHVRLLGLLPLAKGQKREADLIERCKILREYRRYANQLSGLTKPSALRAWEIGMKNLAQAAGYPDPLRLEWAVGADAVKDLAMGPVAVERGGVTVTLALDDLARPVVTAAKGPKPLKAIPPAAKKDKRIAELLARVTDIQRQASSMRQSLEAAMCRADSLSGAELKSWCGHALLAPLLGRLLVVGEGIIGYPDHGGRALRDFEGKLEPVKPRETLRLAHPHDLLVAGQWHLWQRECFAAERVQPFKQIFRELYVLTQQERVDETLSHRYDGQQVQPRQAAALFGSRGWHTSDGVFKVLHDADVTAHVFFQHGITTPLEVEDATLAGVGFSRRGESQLLPLAAIPPRIFSEVMRDLDLVVSVAHSGGVDPEASASTVEMRAGLLRETCTLLRLGNVRLQPTHAVIDGQLAQYSVHLGSGTVHKLPGGALCIVPVHAQHRGRLFLPFADDDPRTAEVVSKVLLLARDQEIQDPTILEQIRR